MFLDSSTLAPTKYKAEKLIKEGLADLTQEFLNDYLKAQEEKEPKTISVKEAWEAWRHVLRE